MSTLPSSEKLRAVPEMLPTDDEILVQQQARQFWNMTKNFLILGAFGAQRVLQSPKNQKSQRR